MKLRRTAALGILNRALPPCKSDQDFTGKMEGTVLHGIIKDGDEKYIVEVSRYKDEMDGTIRMGRNEFLVEAAKAK